MPQNKTILEKIGITAKIVKDWKERGVTITYPMKAKKAFYKSKDGEVL